MGIVAKVSEGHEGLPYTTLAYIESLIHTCTLDEDRKTLIENECNNYSELEAAQAIEYLLQNQKESLNQLWDRAIKNDSTTDNY
jgi:hypothetical protein